jgi:ABC-type dipeptide/oligopeptide/nickel transport system permease subunit
MRNFLDYLMSSQGMTVINALACAIFLGLICVAIVRQSVSLGAFVSGIRRRENPRAFWSVIFLYVAIALWTGVTAASGLL